VVLPVVLPYEATVGQAVALPAGGGSYAELKRIIREHGLLDRRPVRALLRLVLVDLLVVLSVGILLGVHVFWLQCLNALLLAFVSAQLGFNGHDAGHRQNFGSTWKNDVVGLIHGNLLIAMSFSWWMDKHNRHHSHPNELDADPDIAIPFLRFTQEHARRTRGAARFLAAHQAVFFFPLLTLTTLGLQLNSVEFLLRGKARYPKTEALLLALHYVGYVGLLLVALPPWQALVFLLIHKLAMGLYLGSTFAPNHKGMQLLESGSRMDFLRRQVVTSRNVRATVFNDMWYGGLNYQIEHHLFPAMPRANLGKAQRITRAYCVAHGIAYHATGVRQSYREILAYLHAVGAPLRPSTAHTA
jgi:fatty acid desaturase